MASISTPLIDPSKIKEMMQNAQKALQQRKAELSIVASPAPSRSSGFGSSSTTLESALSASYRNGSGLGASRNAFVKAEPQDRPDFPFSSSSMPATKSEILSETSEKLRLTAELQARIQSRMLASGLVPVQQSVKIMPDIKPNQVILDAEGRTIDRLTGDIIEIPHYTPSLKANIRARRANQFKMELQQAKTQTESDEIVDSNYFDHRLASKAAERRGRGSALKFHEPGKFVKRATQMRTRAQLESLQKQIEESAKRTGIASAARLATLQPRAELADEDVPNIEWWDATLLNDTSYESVATLLQQPNATELPEFDTAIRGITNLVEHPVVVAAPETPGELKMNKPSAAKDMTANPLSTPITSAIALSSNTIPVYLTKQERRKVRRQRRLAVQKEQQEKMKLGLLPPPPPKVKMANLMRILGNEAIQDPTKMENYVRQQVADRRRRHEKSNAERKLTPEQRRLKKMRKLCDKFGPGAVITAPSGAAETNESDEGASASSSKLKEKLKEGAVFVSLYRVRDLSNPARKYKVETNARQLLMTGIIILCKDCNLVVVEGGSKQQKKFKRLMLHRIKWSQDIVGLKGSAASDPTREGERNSCFLVWEGVASKRAFGETPVLPSLDSVSQSDAKEGEDAGEEKDSPEAAKKRKTQPTLAVESKVNVRTCSSAGVARELLAKHGVVHYWDLAFAHSVLAETATEEPL